MEFVRKHKFTLILALVVIVVLIGGFLVFKNLTLASKQAQNNHPPVTIDVTFDPEGPYALLVPRNDGNAVDLTINRVSGFDSFSYNIDYQDGDGIERGAGDLNTWVKIDSGKTSYDQEILFGSCSKNVCKYDQGVENGTLTYQIKKGNTIYKIITTWHLQKPDSAQGVLTSADNHFTYKVDTSTQLKGKLSVLNFSIVHDLSGAPKLPNSKRVLGNVYALNVPVGKIVPFGSVNIELSDNPPPDAQIYRYDDQLGDWKGLGTKISGSKLTATSDQGGIFAVLTSNK